MTIFHELVIQTGIADALDGFASVALTTGPTRWAVRLWACAEAVRKTIGAALSPLLRRRCESAVDSDSAQLGARCFEQTWHQGHVKTLDEAVRYALEPDIESP